MNIIAFYLPQFHAIPENDKAYGKGFTEWTNTQKAKPLFDGHYQPKIPLNRNYYNLLDENVMIDQAMLAKRYGIYGFCYYHYWFGNNKKLLEKPIEKMLHDKRIDMPFCLCWANENWTKRWDGGFNEVIVKQEYGKEKEWEKHIEYLMDFFNDERYIKIEDMPVLVIYKPELIPEFRRMVAFFQKYAKKCGLKGIKIVSQHPEAYFSNKHIKQEIDYYIHFEPAFVQEVEKNKGNKLYKLWTKSKGIIKKNVVLYGILKKIKGHKVTDNGPILRDYDTDWRKILTLEELNEKDLAGAFVDWDNTARKKNGITYINGSPDKFGMYLQELCRKVKKSKCENFIFVNAWNEWAEGAYLEPDEWHLYGYLDNLKKAVNDELR